MMYKSDFGFFSISGESLADLIEKNKTSGDVMGESELKQLLIQVAQVL